VRCPDLSYLPLAPEGRVGWPWTDASPRAPATLSDGSAWPRISVVTPSYNQGDYLEETIRSVLLQGYPNLEYIIIDGGSSDNSVEIIRRYQPWLAHWISSKDAGQADAINKGLAHCTGEIFQFINSDDFLDRGALQIVATLMPNHDCVSGPVVEFEEAGLGQMTYVSSALTALNFIKGPPEFYFHQPGVWLRRQQAVSIGGFDADLHFKFDWEFMLRYLDRYPRVAYTDRNIGFSRLHPASKTVSQGERFIHESWMARERVVNRLTSKEAKAELSKVVDKMRWRRKLDKAVENRIKTTTALCLALEALASPAGRLDRYFLGAMRKLLLTW
jgi:glycosyltransferase involved in cell wall biosynthesis